MSVYRIYVEKKEPFAVEAAGVLASLRNDLGLSKLRHVRLLNRYDVEGISREVFDSVRDTVFSEDVYKRQPISRPTGCASSWAATAPKSRPWEPSWTG